MSPEAALAGALALGLAAGRLCALGRVGLRRGIRGCAIRRSCGGFLFAPFFFLYDVFAQDAVFAEEAPVDNLKCFFLFRISHRISF